MKLEYLEITRCNLLMCSSLKGLFSISECHLYSCQIKLLNLALHAKFQYCPLSYYPCLLHLSGERIKYLVGRSALE